MALLMAKTYPGDTYLPVSVPTILTGWRKVHDHAADFTSDSWLSALRGSQSCLAITH